MVAMYRMSLKAKFARRAMSCSGQISPEGPVRSARRLSVCEALWIWVSGPCVEIHSRPASDFRPHFCAVPALSLCSWCMNILAECL